MRHGSLKRCLVVFCMSTFALSALADTSYFTASSNFSAPVTPNLTPSTPPGALSPADQQNLQAVNQAFSTANTNFVQQYQLSSTS